MANSSERIAVGKSDRRYIREIRDGRYFLDAAAPYFEIEGITHPEKNSGEWYRLDASRKDDYSEDVRFLAGCTSGASVRFVTDALSIVIALKHRNNHHPLPHMAARGVHGIDVFCGSGKARRYIGKNQQTFAENADYDENIVELGEGEKEVLINLPMYGGVEYIAIGISPDSTVGLPPERSLPAPIAFYGSSITQGCAASKPSNHFVNIICRHFDAACLNFGFSGSALGEQVIAEYIAKKDFSAFVLDYDYNAPSAEHLRKTHFPFYETVRHSHPDTPILMLSHPFYDDPTPDDLERISVVRESFERARAAGDMRVGFISSEDYYPREMRDLFAVDHLHPNDAAFYFMAEKIIPELEKLLG